MVRLAVFDCDGTLVDSGAAICAAMGDCFAEAGLSSPEDAATRAIVGLSLTEAIGRLLPEHGADLHQSLGEGYKRAFAARRSGGLVHEPLYDGIAEAIAALDRAGWLLGVATGKSDRGLRFCLEHHGLHGRFVTLQTADRHPSKPHPSMLEQAMRDAGAEPGATVMIGDTSFDMAMAKAAGVFAVGVAWGYHAADELRAAGADRIAEHPDELLAIVESMT